MVYLVLVEVSHGVKMLVGLVSPVRFVCPGYSFQICVSHRPSWGHLDKDTDIHHKVADIEGRLADIGSVLKKSREHFTTPGSRHTRLQWPLVFTVFRHSEGAWRTGELN